MKIYQKILLFLVNSDPSVMLLWLQLSVIITDTTWYTMYSDETLNTSAG